MEVSGATAQSCLFILLNSFLALNLVKTYRNMTLSTETLMGKNHPPHRLMPQFVRAMHFSWMPTLPHSPHSSPYSKSCKEWHVSRACNKTCVYHVINHQPKKEGNARNAVSEVLPWKTPLNMRAFVAAYDSFFKNEGMEESSTKPSWCWELQLQTWWHSDTLVYYCSIH